MATIAAAHRPQNPVTTTNVAIDSESADMTAKNPGKGKVQPLNEIDERPRLTQHGVIERTDEPCPSMEADEQRAEAQPHEQ